MTASTLTQDRLKELLHYDPETGIFTWKVSSGRARKGNVAGCFDKNGYRIISVCGKLHFGHRLAWFAIYGKWPDHTIDHINGDPSDNRIVNLRDIDRTGNQQNQRRAQKDNKCGLLGASWCKRAEKWVAQITYKKRRHFLGHFDTAESAHEAYIQAKRINHPTCTI